jgi:hypothetical protein
VTPQPVAPGSVLLHIGPHKTGTTALQSGAASRRPQLEAEGVTYPLHKGRDHHSAAAMAVGGRKWGWVDRGGHYVPEERWTSLVEEVEAAPDRVFLSSEFFAEISGERLDRVIDDLGRSRVHVAVTLRPLAKIVPSFWQQSLKSGSTRTYDAYLEGILTPGTTAKAAETFFSKQDHGAVVERWAAAVGPANLTVVVLDDQKRDMLPRTFEGLLGLSQGLLDPPEGARTNRSMTSAECEVLRRVNEHVRDQNIQWPDYSDIVRYGAVTRMVEGRRPGPDEPALVTPRWALERTAELGEEAAERIKASGVNVIGDLALLHSRPWAGKPEPEVPASTVVPLADAIDLLVGALAGAVGAGAFFENEVAPGQERKKRTPPPPLPKADRNIGNMPVAEVSARDLAQVLRHRLTRAARRRLRR